MHRSPSFRLLLALLALSPLVSCGSGPTGTVAGPDNPPMTEPAGHAAAARFTLQLGKVGVLSKTSAIQLRRLVLTATSGTEVVRADSLVPAWFAGGQTVTLNHDYVNPGAHGVTLEAYGEMDGYEGLMFAGSALFDSEAGPEGSKPVTLAWAGPSNGGGEATLILGHIGKVTVVGAFNPNL